MPLPTDTSCYARVGRCGSKAVRGGDPPPSYINRVASKSKTASSSKAVRGGEKPEPLSKAAVTGVESKRPYTVLWPGYYMGKKKDPRIGGVATFRKENEEKNLKIRDCRSAEQAMAFYNNKHGTDYEIVETLGSFRGISRGFWIHCNFKAQRKSVTDTDDGEQYSDDELHSCSPRLFFAESYSDGDKWHVNFCDIVDDRLRCSICAPLLRHPREFKAFVKGKPKRKKKIVDSCRYV